MFSVELTEEEDAVCTQETDFLCSNSVFCLKTASALRWAPQKLQQREGSVFSRVNTSPAVGQDRKTALWGLNRLRTTSESDRWSGWNVGGGVGRSPKLPSHLKQHREVYLNELPFPPSWPTRDWSEKWAVAVFPARLPRGWGGPGVLNPAASLPDGPRRRGCSLPQSAAWWTLVCVPSVRRMGWETAEMRLLPPWPPKQGF